PAAAARGSLRLLTPVDVIFGRAHRQLTPVDAMHPLRAARISRNEATLFYLAAARQQMQTLAHAAYNTPMPDDTVTASHPIAFPKLDAADLAALAPLASCSEYSDGQYVFRAGDADLDLFVVDSGAIEILNPADGDRHVVTHGPGQFAGDIDLLTRRPVIVNAIARGKTRLMRVPGARLREILHKVPR